MSFLGYAYRSLTEVVTGLELCEGLYPSLQPLVTLIDEGDQISRRTRSPMQRLDAATSDS